MSDLRFDGKDSMLIFDFLHRFAVEGDTLEMSDGQTFNALPHLLSGLCLEQYRTICGSLTADEGGVGCWAEDAQYLLRSYATSTAILEVILALRDVSQKRNGKQAEYSSRLNQAAICS